MNNIIMLKNNHKFETPIQYGCFHIFWLIYTIIIIIYILIFSKNKSDKRNANVVFSFGLFFLFLEIYKQLFYFIRDGYYNWALFPFQFCSTPMYTCLLIKLFSLKVKEYIYRFLAFFSMLGGLIVMLYPVTVFTSDFSMSIHTMVWHSAMIILGVYLINSRNYYQDKKSKINNIKQGFVVLLIVTFIALSLNYLMYKMNILDNNYFNMFNISPYYPRIYPIIGKLFMNVPYIIFLGCYLLAFLLGALVINIFVNFLHKRKVYDDKLSTK